MRHQPIGPTEAHRSPTPLSLCQPNVLLNHGGRLIKTVSWSQENLQTNNTNTYWIYNIFTTTSIFNFNQNQGSQNRTFLTGGLLKSSLNNKGEGHMCRSSWMVGRCFHCFAIKSNRGVSYVPSLPYAYPKTATLAEEQFYSNLYFLIPSSPFSRTALHNEKNAVNLIDLTIICYKHV